jgi:RNA polymerase sigma factor (sigma-70 family)
MSGSQTAHVQRCLDRLRAGDEAARQELLGGASERLTRLTRAMLRDYPRLKRWEETGDVLQNALVRLHRALQQLTPATPRDFYRLATLQIRRELIDLARHHYGPEGAGGRHESVAGRAGESDSRPPGYEPADAADSPGRLAEWAEFHEQTEGLPEDEREVFDLVWYQGLTHAEAATLLNVSTKTVQRRWHAACLKLHDRLGGELPGV